MVNLGVVNRVWKGPRTRGGSNSLLLLRRCLDFEDWAKRASKAAQEDCEFCQRTTSPSALWEERRSKSGSTSMGKEAFNSAEFI